jgi:hypothetical protein
MRVYCECCDDVFDACFRQRWNEVNDLEKKREEIKKKGVVTKVTGDEDGEEELDEADLDEFLDWRSKKSWK